MFERIPSEMRAYRQWIVWRLEWREDDPEHLDKPTKIPYQLNGYKASVTNPAHWASFDEVVAAVPKPDPHTVHDPKTSLEISGYSGIGFVLTDNDPYGFIDLDDTKGNQADYDRQVKIFREFSSYSELSPSGKGLHTIIKGSIPHGRRRASIEVYSNERYMTMTGNVYADAPIMERQELFTLLFNQMGGPPTTYDFAVDQPERDTDETIIHRAMNAANGEKFSELYAGDHQKFYGPQFGHDGTGHSEADFGLIDIIAFYTQNKAQIRRIFRASNLGKRDKAQRDKYLNDMVDRSYDRMLPPVDIDGLRIALEGVMRSEGAVPGGTAPSPVNHLEPACEGGGGREGDNLSSHGPQGASSLPVGTFPPGLIGEVAQFIYDAAPRPVAQIALAGAIGLLAGITGRAYNISGTGLNQYVLLLAPTGTGKEAIQNGISKLMDAISTQVPASSEFIGPGTIRSDAGLLKWLSQKPCIVSTVGEIGVWIKQLSHPNANSHELGLKKVILDLFNKSGHKNKFDPMAYSDKDKNTAAISAPSFTLMGESTPQGFYEILDESMIASGLLPRFLTMEYVGMRPALSTSHISAQPTYSLVDRFGGLAAHCLGIMNTGTVINVQTNGEAQELFNQFEVFTTAQINSSASEVVRHLWNRAHIKALKLAALCAVGIYPFNPLITVHEARWATDLVVGEVRNLLAKFEAGEVGQGAYGVSENKQEKEVVRVITEYLTLPHEKAAKYGATFNQHQDSVVPYAYVQRRLAAVSAFRLDRNGPAAALKRTLQIMFDTDELRELPKNQMQAKYGRSERAFVVANPTRFKPLK